MSVRECLQCFIYNSQKMKTAQVSIHPRMDKESEEYSFSGVPHSNKRNELLICTATQVPLKSQMKEACSREQTV
jgi:hypothetical protein